jgi:hypothetical protein
MLDVTRDGAGQRWRTMFMVVGYAVSSRRGSAGREWAGHAQVAFSRI